MSSPKAPSSVAIAAETKPLRDELSRNTQRLVFHIDIFLMSIGVCFILLSLSRVIARFSRAAEWTQGYFLHSAPIKFSGRRRPLVRDVGVPNVSPDNQSEMWTEESHTYNSHTLLVRRPSERRGEKGSRSSYPPHIPEWPAAARPLGWLLRCRVAPGFSLGQLLTIMGYSAIMVYGWFYNSNPVTDPNRTGFLAVSQIPVVFAFATKNNLVGLFIGAGYEKLNYLHRYTGKLITIAANVHALGYFYIYTAAGTLGTRSRTPNFACGLVSLLALNTLTIFSMSFWRNRAYTFFFNTHVVAFCVLLPALCFHASVITPYVLVAVGLYSLDHIVRLIKTRICKATIFPLPDLLLTRVSVPALNTGWRAGQHVRLRVFSSGMGMWGWTEAHPFTISSLGRGGEGMVLFCKRNGDWTGKLYEMAKASGYGDGNALDADAGREVRVLVEGPYGGPGHMVFASYSAAVFVVGGSGITFALAAIQDLVQKDLEARSRVKVIELIWMIQDPGSLTPLYAQFVSLIQQSIYTPLRISIHYTRATKVPIPAKNYIPGLSLSPGRPRIGKVLDSAIARAVTLGSGRKEKDEEAITGLLVGVCGPVGLRDEVSRVVGNVEADRRDKVGGVEVYEEVFGW